MAYRMLDLKNNSCRRIMHRILNRMDAFGSHPGVDSMPLGTGNYLYLLLILAISQQNLKTVLTIGQTRVILCILTSGQ